MQEQVLRVFVSSPGDVADERRRVDLVVERLNGEFAGRVRLETVRWERSYYSAHETFQKQIPEAGECDVVVAVFRGRLGTALPSDFPPLPSGDPYPSGSAYEVLSAVAARKAHGQLPDIYVFRYPSPPAVVVDSPDEADIRSQWARLKAFFDTWFRTETGQFLAAFQSYASTDDFAAKVEDCLRQFLARRGFLPKGPVWDRILRGTPFPGLAPFEADREGVFYGRELAVTQAVARLREAGQRGAPFLLIVGASGSGKSSLLRAGLLPGLTRPGAIPEVDLWRPVVVTPGPDPFLALAEALFAETAIGPELRKGTFRTRELLAKQLAGDPDTALAPIRDALDRAAAQRRGEAGFDAPRPARLALAVDQAERLFTEAEGAKGEAFAALLVALVRQGLAYAVMALRSDAYPRLQGSEALVGLRSAGETFDLLPPSLSELEQIVTRPVAACQPPLGFEQREGRSLALRLVADAKGGDVLPLLQVTLARLYAAEAGRHDGLLRYDDYRGMDAAVTETANEALALLDETATAELPAMIAGLVADVVPDPATGAAMPLVTALDRPRFEAGSPARARLIEAFVEKRLLTAEGDGATRRVRPVHEALLRIWPEAVAILAETAALIRVRRTLEPLVREWSGAAAGEKPGYLHISGALLDGAQQLLARFGADLPGPMRAFIAQAAAADAARRDHERQEQARKLRDARRLTQRTLAGLAVALLLAGVAGWQGYEARVQRNDARVQRDRAQHTLELATATANGLVFDLAQKFRNVVGVPASMVKDILDRASQLQDQLLGSGEASPALRRSQAAALDERATTLLTLGQTQDALAAAKQSQSIMQALLAHEPDSTDFQRELSVSQDRVGDVLQAQGDWPNALASYRASLAIADRLAQSDPGNAGWQHDLSVSQNKVGDVQVAQGDWPNALASYRASLAIRDRLAQSDPGNAGWQRDLSVSQDKVGDGQVAQGDWPNALASYRASLAIRDRLAQSDPGNAGWQRDLSVSQDKVGDVLVAQGDLPNALASYRASLAILERLAQSDPGNAGWQHDLSVSQDRVGDVLAAQGDWPNALASYRASLAILERLAQSDPGNAGWQRDLAVSYARVGGIEARTGARDDAIGMLQKGRDIIAHLVQRSPTTVTLRQDLAWFDRAISSLKN